MTEAEWLTCIDPKPMLEFLRGKASERKLRLFAVACCRRVWHLLLHEFSREAVEVAERFADGAATDQELEEAKSNAWEFADHMSYDERFCDLDAYDDARNAFDAPAWATEWSADKRSSEYDGCPFRVVVAIQRAVGTAEDNAQADLIRCIFGNHFQPVAAIDPAWLTPRVVELARTSYGERVFERMPDLADALERAGCTIADILTHCRQAGEHVRGC